MRPGALGACSGCVSRTCCIQYTPSCSSMHPHGASAGHAQGRPITRQCAVSEQTVAAVMYKQDVATAEVVVLAVT